ncbi:exlusion protein FxsA [Vibrio tarriae]|nr:exlusion protein FxsA [Vibrio tarriae]
MENCKLTNASKGLPTRGVFSPIEPLWLLLLCLSLVVMRCQPLRRALCLITKNQWIMVFLCSLS